MPSPAPRGSPDGGEGYTRRLYVGPWRVEVTVRPGVPLLLPVRRLARLAARSLEAAGAPRPASVGIIFSDDGELAALNARHMGIPGPTDVLSFPLLPPGDVPPHRRVSPPGAGGAATAGPGGAGGAPTAGPAGPGKGVPFVLPPGRRPHLGDVVVSVERAIDQARSGRGGQTGDRRWDPADEVRLLVIHGILHLCGWDHGDPEEAAAMRALEGAILAGS